MIVNNLNGWITLTLPAGFSESQDWKDMRQGRSPFPWIDRVNELNLTRLLRNDLIALGIRKQPLPPDPKSDIELLVFETWSDRSSYLANQLFLDKFPNLKKVVISFPGFAISHRTIDLLEKKGVAIENQYRPDPAQASGRERHCVIL